MQCHYQQQCQWEAVWAAEHKCKKRSLCSVGGGIDVADECSVLRFSDPDQYDICEHPNFAQVVDGFSEVPSQEDNSQVSSYPNYRMSCQGSTYQHIFARKLRSSSRHA